MQHPLLTHFPFPVSSNYFTTVAGARLHYLDEGPRTAPTVVMLHGNPTWCFYWRYLLQALMPNHRCIVPDHVGMGASDKPRKYPYTLPRRVRDLDDLLTDLGIESGATLIVHDWGGMIGCADAVLRPGRYERFVLTNTAAFLLPPTTSFPWQLTAARTPLLGAAMVRGRNAFCRYARRHCMSRRELSPDAAAGLLAPYDTWANRVAVQAFVDDIPLTSGDPWYAYINRIDAGLQLLRQYPCLILWGLRDFVFDRHFLQAWRQRLPEAEVHAWPDGGHYILEDYRDEVVSRVVDFCR